jgi:hypothetical protein
MKSLLTPRTWPPMNHYHSKKETENQENNPSTLIFCRGNLVWLPDSQSGHAGLPVLSDLSILITTFFWSVAGRVAGLRPAIRERETLESMGYPRHERAMSRRGTNVSKGSILYENTPYQYTTYNRPRTAILCTKSTRFFAGPGVYGRGRRKSKCGLQEGFPTARTKRDKPARRSRRHLPSKMPSSAALCN